MNMLASAISHIIQRRRSARILHRLKHGHILTQHGGQDVSTVCLVRNMAAERKPLARWAAYHPARHNNHGAHFYGQKPANTRGQSWLEPTWRGKLWMLFLVLTTIKRRDW